MKTKNDSLIHVKLDYEEAVQSKKDILLTESELIKSVQAIRKYKEFRMKEIALKLELIKRLRDFKTHWRNTRNLLPPMELPKIVEEYEEGKHKKSPHKESKKSEHEKKAKVKEERHHDNLELQLKEIQEKLNRLG
ncbi:MAG: hypothetical protein AABW63_01005 [Nanoarchaeota archaeon]